MQKQNILYSKASFGFGKKPERPRISQVIPRICLGRDKNVSIIRTVRLELLKNSDSLLLQHPERIKLGAANGNLGPLYREDDEEDEDLCPVDCVKEFKSDEEFVKILEKAKENDSLVVVDFYRTSCGSCKYIEQGFAKLCRGAGDDLAPVIFLKHNVIDEYDEQSEVAERLRIKTVPLFHFYKNGALLEAFATRDKERITAAILKYSAPASKAT